MVALLQSSKGGFFFARDDWNPWSNRSSVGGVKQNRGLSNFRVKFHESSALEAKCYLKVIRCAPNVKIQFFAKETWTCSKQYISFSSVGYSSRIRNDFRGSSTVERFCACFRSLPGCKLLPHAFIFMDLDGWEAGLRFSEENWVG